MMEAARSSEKMVNFYQTTRRYNPEGSHLRTNRYTELSSDEPTQNEPKKSLKMAIFWDVAPSSLVDTDRHFRGAYCLHHQGEKSLFYI
jgi:hypothetical protein